MYRLLRDCYLQFPTLGSDGVGIVPLWLSLSLAE